MKDKNNNSNDDAIAISIEQQLKAQMTHRIWTASLIRDYRLAGIEREFTREQNALQQDYLLERSSLKEK